MSHRYDIIVIGAGHNGLTTAALLAKAGRTVLALEGRDQVGGLAASEEFHPGYRTPGVLHDTSRVRPWVVEELGLRRHGLRFRPEPLPTLLPEREGDGILLFRDPDKAAEELSRRSMADAEGYREFRRFLDRIKPAFLRLFDRPPLELFDTGLGDLARLGRTALSLRLLGKKDMMEVLRIAPMCVADWLNESFETDLLKAGLAAPALDGAWAAPWSPGTSATLLMTEALTGAPVEGGAPALIDALEKAARAQGVEIRCGAAVEEILLDNNGVSGVTLRGGERLEAKKVAASCDPGHVFLDLLPSTALSASVERDITNFRNRGIVAKIDLALSAYPELTCRPGLEAERIRTGETFDELERAFDPVKYRQLSRRPFSTSWCRPSRHPILPPRDTRFSRSWRTALPTTWKAPGTSHRGRRFYRRVVDTLEEYAPGAKETIVGHRVLTPFDLESEFGVSSGHLYDGSMPWISCW